MKTKIVDKNCLLDIKESLNKGEIVAFPTETVFGLACVFDSKVGYQKLIDAKKRPKEKAFPFVVGNKEDIKFVASLNEMQQKIVDSFFPGPLTIIVKKNKNVEDYLTNGKDTIAIRMPDDQFVLDLIKELGKPILLTSANLSGEDAALNSDEAFNIFDGVVSYVVEGESKSGVASTIVDLTTDKIKIVREGKIGLMELEEAVK